MHNQIVQFLVQDIRIAASMVLFVVGSIAYTLWKLPPRLGSFTHEDLRETRCYFNRVNRKGIEPRLDYTKPQAMQFVSHARVMGPARERRIIHLPGNVV